jgi:hypothetical protein
VARPPLTVDCFMPGCDEQAMAGDACALHATVEQLRDAAVTYREALARIVRGEPMGRYEWCRAIARSGIERAVRRGGR